MGQLEGDHEVGVVAVGKAVGGANRVAKRGEAGLAAGGAAELIGVGTSLGHDGHRLAPPDELCTARAEPLPAAEE